MAKITGTIVWFAGRSSLQTNTIQDVNVAKLGYGSVEWDCSRRKGRYNMAQELKRFKMWAVSPDGVCEYGMDEKQDGNYYEADEVDAVLAEKDAEIAQLKDKLQAAEKQTENLINSASSLMLGQDKMNDKLDDEIRRLKRTLWLARAAIANSIKYKYHRLSCKAEIDPQPHGWSCYINGEVYRTGKMNRKLEPYYWIELWEEVERKCRAKAEEYK